MNEHERFQEIIQKYNLERKAEEISTYLTTQKINIITVHEFAEKFSLSQEDAQFFLSWIRKGIEFREKHFTSQQD